MSAKLYPELQKSVEAFDLKNIPVERRSVLQPLIEYIQAKAEGSEYVLLNFICTHNSRRSHLTQVWAQTAAFYYDVKNVACYSGGTEATALFPMVADTLRNAGFRIEVIADGTNPVYAIKYAANQLPVIGFSKSYDDSFNPETGFVAILTCSQADGGCPFIAGAEKRVPITFDDPKEFDNSPLQSDKYEERSKQIATEIFYVFSQIKS